MPTFKFGSFPFQPQEWLTLTARLSAAEAGGLIKLRAFAWLVPGCDLPDDDAKLKRLSGLTTEEWAESGATIRSFFDSCDDKLFPEDLLRHRRLKMKRRKVRLDDWKARRQKASRGDV
jgi:uncharacterized protein YdaU (DUF1376 family)